MKRIISVFAVFTLLLSVIGSGNAERADSLTVNQKRQLEKRQWKATRSLLKEIKRAGYEINGPGILENKVLRHYERLDSLGRDGVELLGRGYSKSRNASRMIAKHGIAVEYADRCAALLDGRFIYDLVRGYPDDEALKACYGVYAAILQKKIFGIVEESFSICKAVPGVGGFANETHYENRTMFLLDEKEARKMRLEAMEEALAASGVGGEHEDYLKECAAAPILNRYEDLISF